MTEEFKEEVRLENEKKKSMKISESNKNRVNSSNTLQLECNESREHNYTWTDDITAKKAGVGTGTVANSN